MNSVAGRFADHYLRGHLAPYVHSHHLVGTQAHLLEAAQPAGDMSDPACDDLAIIRALSPGVHHRSDFGGGVFEERSAAGVFFFTPPGFGTTINVFNNHRIRVLSVNRIAVLGALAEMAIAQRPVDFGHLHKGSHSDAVTAHLFDAVWHLGVAPDPGDALLGETLILMLLRRLATLAQCPPDLRQGGLSSWQIRRVLEYMDAMTAEPIRLENLASLAGLSPFHFCRAFKASLGVPPHRYQQLARIERARALLDQETVEITDIAFQLGYGSSQAFARAFRREVGKSPTDYRKSRH